MRFTKIKLKRCKNCIYYRELGRLRYCVKTKYFKKDGDLELICPIPLMCFKKKRGVPKNDKE